MRRSTSPLLISAGDGKWTDPLRATKPEMDSLGCPEHSSQEQKAGEEARGTDPFPQPCCKGFIGQAGFPLVSTEQHCSRSFAAVDCSP